MIISKAIDKAVVEALRLGHSENAVARRYNIRVSAVREIAVQALYVTEAAPAVTVTGRHVNHNPVPHQLPRSGMTPGQWYALSQRMAEENALNRQMELALVRAATAKQPEPIEVVLMQMFGDILPKAPKAEAKPETNVYQLVQALSINEKRNLMKSLVLEIYTYDQQNKTPASSSI